MGQFSVRVHGYDGDKRPYYALYQGRTYLKGLGRRRYGGAIRSTQEARELIGDVAHRLNLTSDGDWMWLFHELGESVGLFSTDVYRDLQDDRLQGSWEIPDEDLLERALRDLNRVRAECPSDGMPNTDRPDAGRFHDCVVDVLEFIQDHDRHSRYPIKQPPALESLEEWLHEHRIGQRSLRLTTRGVLAHQDLEELEEHALANLKYPIRAVLQELDRWAVGKLCRLGVCWDCGRFFRRNRRNNVFCHSKCRKRRWARSPHLRVGDEEAIEGLISRRGQSVSAVGEQIASDQLDD